MPLCLDSMSDRPDLEILMDVLTDVLNTLNLKGWLASRTEIATSWRFEYTPSQDIIFHILHTGSGYLYVEGEAAPLQVREGDVMMFPYGHAHTLCDKPVSPLTLAVSLSYEEFSEKRLHLLVLEPKKPDLVMLCGAFHFENPGDYPLLKC